ncbi:FadR/GntR family transcriptional regulator [Photobacterium sp. DNB23_23_1]
MEKKLTAADEIIQDIAEQIINKKYHPKDKLPNERDLAEQYGVSRGRIREALRGLSTAGLIEIRSNQGSFVKEYSDRVTGDVMSWLLHPPHTTFIELFEVREILEKAMYIKAFEQCNGLDFEKIEKAYEQLTLINPKDITAYADALDHCDKVMARTTRNPLFINLIETMVALRRKTVERLLVQEGSSERSISLRKDIISAFRSRNREQVVKAVDRFFTESKKPFEEE